MAIDAYLAAHLTEWPEKEKMASILRLAGLHVTVGRYSICIDNFHRFRIQHYGGDMEPQIQAEAQDAETLAGEARRVSDALANAGIVHRFEIWQDDDSEDMLYCFHHGETRSVAPIPNAKVPLLEVLRDTRALLALPDNEFVWSRWNSAAEAVAEFDSFVSCIEAARSFDASELSVLFAPTGAIHDVSVCSGWGDEFIRVAERFDTVFAQYESTGNA